MKKAEKIDDFKHVLRSFLNQEMTLKEKKEDYNDDASELKTAFYERGHARRGRERSRGHGHHDTYASSRYLHGASSSKFEGKCHHCERTRHKQVDCWKKDKIRDRS